MNKPITQLARMKVKLFEKGWLLTHYGELDGIHRFAACHNTEPEFCVWSKSYMKAFGNALRVLGITSTNKLKPKEREAYLKKYSIEYGFKHPAMRSYRLRVFLSKGITCVSCGLTGSFFALVRNGSGIHFNLYAKKSEDEDVLMTCDHIIPKSKGGTNTMSNLQPMCSPCNSKKGDKIVEVLP